MSAVNNDQGLFHRAQSENREKIRGYLESIGYLKGREATVITLVKDQKFPVMLHSEQGFTPVAIVANRTQDFLTHHLVQFEPCHSYGLAVCTGDREVSLIRISAPQGSRISHIEVSKGPACLVYKEQMIDPSLNDQ